MAYNVVCSPALGQTTVVREDNVKISVWLDAGDGEDAWEVEIWHNGNTEQHWASLELSPRSRRNIMLMNPSDDSSTSGRKPQEFFGILPRPTTRPGIIQFTIKCRKRDEAWQWINDQSPQEDGQICFQDLEHISADLTEYLPNLADEFAVNCVTSSHHTESQLWSLVASIDPTRGSHSTFRTLRLGLPSMVLRWFSLVRISRAWLAPRQGKGTFSVSEDAILASILRCDGLHLTLLAISIDDVLTVFNSDDRGNIFAVARNDSLTQGKIQIVTAVSTTFESGIVALLNHARGVVGDTSSGLSVEQQNRRDGVSEEAGTQELENWQDSFTYCTWNGLGQQLNEAMIMGALDVMAKRDIQITNLIIDDGWQSLDDNGDSSFRRRWLNFDADEANFQNGLKSTITNIKETYPFVKYIAVWHGIFGYWGGVSPLGQVYKNYRTLESRKQQDGLLAGGTMTVIDAKDAFKLYDEFYAFLYDAGINSVKADTQFFLDLLDDASDRRALIKTCQDAWTRASIKYFGRKTISCMSQIPQILFHSQLPNNKPRFTVRNSDDFFPDEPSSHGWHIFCNAHNAVLTQHLNVLPDWDMFQTNHPYSAFHAAARCVSGGPITFTDKPGEHSIVLIDQVTAKAPVRRIVLRPGVGMTTQVYTAHRERAFCKIASYSGPKESGSSILGVFNVGESPLSGFAALAEFPNILPRQAYVVRAHTSGVISAPMRLECDDPPLMLLHLDHWGYEILTAHALRSFTLAGIQATDIAVLGLLHKMTGAAAVRCVEIIQAEDNDSTRLRLKVSLKALGILGVYVSDLPQRDILPDDATLNGKAFAGNLLRRSERDSRILEINLQGAWVQVEAEVDWEEGVTVEFSLR